MNLIDWIGTIGVAMILLAYLLNVFKKLRTDQVSFILLNLIGASMACIASALINYIPFIILEAVWTFVSLIALLKYFIKNYGGRKKSAQTD